MVLIAILSWKLMLLTVCVALLHMVAVLMLGCVVFGVRGLGFGFCCAGLCAVVLCL